MNTKMNVNPSSRFARHIGKDQCTGIVNHLSHQIALMSSRTTKGECIMKSRTMLNVTLLAILMAMLVAACGGTRLYTSQTSQKDFNAETSNDVVDFDAQASPRMSSHILQIKMNLDAGQLVFRVSSPDGQVKLEETIKAPANYQHKFDLDTVPGLWKLAIELEDATGNYDIDWKTDN